MRFKESERFRTKLLALDLRLYEMNEEMKRTHLRMLQLEAQMEDARLASLFGEAGQRATDLDPQLEEARAQLDRQKEVIRNLQDSRAETRVLLALARRREQLAPGTPEPEA